MLLDHKKEPEFSPPIRQAIVMVVILFLVGAGGVFLYPSLSPVFLANPWLNGFILAVFVLGVLACFWQVLQLFVSVGWIEGFALDRPGHEFVRAPRLLASLAALLSDSRARKSLTSNSTRSILDSVATRLDEARDITRYIVNLLIFLGLLGTFYGLATTVPAVVDTIRSLAPQEGQSSMEVFDRLMTGLEEQLGGMGTAFASSLLGLAGSLVVGILELFAGHGQNRFYMELEEWLSSITRISFSSGDSDGGFDGSAVVGMMEQTTHQIESMRELVMRGEEQRMRSDSRLGSLTEAVSTLAKTLSNNSTGGRGATGQIQLLERIAQGQDRIAETQMRVAEGQQQLAAALGQSTHGGEAMDSETRARLRNIDTHLLRVLEEMSAGRQDSVSEIRQDLNTLINTLRMAIADGEG